MVLRLMGDMRDMRDMRDMGTKGEDLGGVVEIELGALADYGLGG